MNNDETISRPSHAGRRRLLGALVVSAAPAALATMPMAARATDAGSGDEHPPDSPAGDVLLHREGWLLAPGDR